MSLKWTLPDGDFMLCKKDKRFTEHVAYISFEASKIVKAKFKLVKADKASVFRKDSENLILLQTKYALKLSRLKKKKMLLIVSVKEIKIDESLQIGDPSS